MSPRKRVKEEDRDVQEEAAKKASFMSVLAQLHEKAAEHNDPGITKLADRIGRMTKWC